MESASLAYQTTINQSPLPLNVWTTASINTMVYGTSSLVSISYPNKFKLNSGSYELSVNIIQLNSGQIRLKNDTIPAFIGMKVLSGSSNHIATFNFTSSDNNIFHVDVKPTTEYSQSYTQSGSVKTYNTFDFIKS